MANYSLININIKDGGLGTVAEGKDFFTGLIFQSATLPAGYGTDSIKRIYSPADLETYGITEALFPVAHYQISEYFRILGKYNKVAWIDCGFYDIDLLTFTGAEIVEMQNNASGELRQIGLFLTDTFASSIVTTLNTTAETLNNEGTPVQLYLSADITDATALTNLRTLNKKWVSTMIGMDGAGKGFELFEDLEYSICALGVQLGLTAVAKVHEALGRGIYDVSDSVELQTIALADGTFVKNLAKTLIDQLDSYGYTLFVPVIGLSGTYFYKDSQTASLSTSDFITQNRNRVITKVKRGTQSKLAPFRNSPLYVDSTTGKLSDSTIQTLRAEVLTVLNEMATAGEISYSQATGQVSDNSVIIDANQNVLSTNKIEITVKIVPVGTASEINVNIGFAVQI